MFYAIKITVYSRSKLCKERQYIKVEQTFDNDASHVRLIVGVTENIYTTELKSLHSILFHSHYLSIHFVFPHPICIFIIMQKQYSSNHLNYFTHFTIIDKIGVYVVQH